MKHAVGAALGMLAMLSVAMAGKKQAACVIEPSTGLLTDSMPAQDLKRFKEGKLPRFWNTQPLPYRIRQAGLAEYRCLRSESDKGQVKWHRTSPQLALETYADEEISLDSLFTHKKSLGMRVSRRADGRVLQASNFAEVYFFSEEKSKITVDRYLTLDCETKSDGLMVPRAGAQWTYRLEQWENPKERKAKSRVIRSRQQMANGKPDRIVVTTFSESTGRTEVASTTYLGKTEAPENRTGHISLQRVRWPEGPGYLQIKKTEKIRPDGGMELISHVIESWKVGDDGSRTVVKTEDLLEAEQEDADPEEVF